MSVEKVLFYRGAGNGIGRIFSFSYKKKGGRGIQTLFKNLSP